MAEIKKQNLRAAFVHLQSKGASASGIARLFGVKRQTVSDAVVRFNELGNNQNRPGSGRKRDATDLAHQNEVAKRLSMISQKELMHVSRPKESISNDFKFYLFNNLL